MGIKVLLFDDDKIALGINRDFLLYLGDCVSEVLTVDNRPELEVILGENADVRIAFFDTDIGGNAWIGPSLASEFGAKYPGMQIIGMSSNTEYRKYWPPGTPFVRKTVFGSEAQLRDLIEQYLPGQDS